MQTGLNAWIANQEFPGNESVQVSLPGGWYWDVSSDRTGYLMTPDNMRCVGYDLNQDTIQFGQDGEVKAPGLNLWTVQEMGERFARENFMDEATAKEYDAFFRQRGDERKAYEKGVREEMKGIITMELSEGQWTAHVDADAVMAMTGISSKTEMSRQHGIMLFNRMSEMCHVMPLRDPMGYMVPEENVYDYIKDQYDFQYNDTIENIDNGFINGNGRGCEKVLDKLDAVVRKNVREYCLPDGVNYQDLRFIQPTPEICDAVDEFVKWRVTKTVNYEKKRDHTKESLQRDHEKFLAAADRLQEKIADAALIPLDVSLGADTTLNM